MNKLSIALRSRTVWVLAGIFIINGIEGIRELISPEVLKYLDPALLILAAYFRVSPKATSSV